MANHIVAARRRAELTALVPEPAIRPSHPVFTDADWHVERIARELADCLAVITRWRITVLPKDGCPRHFYLCGLLDHVERRAALIFGPHTHLVAIEPAAAGNTERIDRRLSLGDCPP